MTPLVRKVVVIGLDGLDPELLDDRLAHGEAPSFARLAVRGTAARVATTCPAQTPVAWSSFATGTNPGGHGIYDFIRRDPATCLPDLSLTRYEQKNAFVPPRAVNRRGGTAVWTLLSDAGIPSTVLRCPCTFPPDTIRGRMLAGMGVPDLRGGLGTSSFYTTGAATAGESEQVLPLAPSGNGTFKAAIVGPRNTRGQGSFELPVTVSLDRAARRVRVSLDAEPSAIDLAEGEWSPWLRLRFKTGLLQSVRGMVRLRALRLEPIVELYASPVNFDPDAPLFPVSAPPEYAAELASAIGTFYTTGMVEDHGALNNGRFNEDAYLAHCDEVMRERERMLHYELDRFDTGLLFCLFDTPDRLQHMLWRHREPSHPANQDSPARPEYARAIDEHYRHCDAVVGRVLDRIDDQTMIVVLSDHGFGSFQRGFHLNTWLHDQGLLALKPGCRPGADAGDMLQAVDWARTRAYALGIGSVYVNVKGREARGIVEPDDVPRLSSEIAHALDGIVDPAGGAIAVRGGSTRHDVYSGPFAAESPDVVVRFSRGYRASWSTALGGVPEGQFEDNTKRWGGDHIVDPALVPGVLFANRPIRTERAALVDLAPTMLAALGVTPGAAMEGSSLLS